jgi:L-aspartate oxidase
MQNYDERLELAPRDVVSHAIMLESKKTNSTDFYLDISQQPAEFVTNRFPMIYKNLLEQGYDLTKDRVPIFPCQHYLMGGIGVDSFARTDINNLYAVGECSNTGVHGNNRLASNSLLEALVFSRRGAGDINSKAFDVPNEFEEYTFEQPINAEPIPTGIRTEVRHIMQQSYFVIPDKKSAVEGFERIKELKKLLSEGNYIINSDYVEAKSLVTVAYLILKEVI